MSKALSHKLAVNCRSRGIIALATFLLVGICHLHFWRLDQIPGALFRDEASIAYNAWCIKETGHDEHGVGWPLSFRGFGNYHDPVLVYSLAPWINADRLTAWHIRLPSAVCFLAATIAFGKLAGRQLGSRDWGMAGACLFAALPWTFAVSRIAAGGYAPMLFGIIVGWHCLSIAATSRSIVFAFLASIGWATAMYSHHTGRPLSAILLLMFLATHWKATLKHWQIALAFAATLMVELLPLGYLAHSQPAFLTARFKVISIANDSPALGELLRRFLERYGNHFSPGFLFLQGDPSPVLHTGCGGVLFASMVLPIVVGIWQAIRRHAAGDCFLLAGIAVFPFASALTLEPVHSTRSINGAPFFCLLALIGWRHLAKGGHLARFVAAVSALGLAVEATRYQLDYFGPYWDRAAPHFEAEFQDALRIAFRALDSTAERVVAFETTAFPWPVDARHRPLLYVHGLVVGRIPPRQYLRSNGMSDGIRTVARDEIPPCVLVRRREGPWERNLADLPSPTLDGRQSELFAVVPIRQVTLDYERHICIQMKRPAFRPPNRNPVRYEIWRVR